MAKPRVVLVGTDGNAFSILALCRKAARKAGWSDEQWEKVSSEMKAGDYDHLLAKAQEHFEVR